MYAVQKDIWHLTGRDKSIVEQLYFLPVKVGEKPDNWQPSGKRIKRGLYCSAQKLILNADVNGAANIIRKSKVATDLIVKRVGSGLLTNPLRIKLWVDLSPSCCP